MASTTSQSLLALSGCSEDDLADLPQNAESTCAETMDENQQCTLVCPDDFQSIGYFTFSRGVFVGESKCEAPRPGASITVSTKIAATMSVQVEFLRDVPHNVTVQLLKQGIADALGLSEQDVVKFKAVEVGSSPGVQALQGSTKHFEVSYEVLPPRSMNADAVLQKAKAISIKYGAAGQVEESNAFQQAVSRHEDVAQVLTAVEIIVARKFEDEVLTVMPQPLVPEQEDKGDNLLPLWITLAVIAGLCLLFVLIVVICRPLYKKKLANADEDQDLEAQASLDDVVLRVPSQTLLDQGPVGDKSDTRGVGLQQETWPGASQAEKSYGFV